MKQASRKPLPVSINSTLSHSSKGFGLIEVLVAIGLVAILSTVLSSVITNSLKVQKSIDEKFVLQDTKNFLTNAFINSAVCADQLGGPILDLSSTTTTVKYPSDIPYTVLRAGSLPTSPLIAQVGQNLPGSQIMVNSIVLKDVYRVGTGNVFQGLLQINVDPTTLTMPRKPTEMRIIFTTSTPLTAANIISCRAEGGGFNGVPQSLGQFSGSYNGMNNQPYAIFVNANGGNATVSGDDANPCHLRAVVSAVTVAINQDNNKEFAKICSIYFAVPANTAYQIFSSPYPVGTGRFEVIESR